MKRVVFIAKAALCVASVRARAEESLSAEQKAFFETKIRPVLASYCYKCHSVEEKKAKGDLTLDTDLTDIFNVSRRRKKGVRPAIDFLRENRKTITDKVTYWTGVQRPLLKKLIEAIEARVAELQLNVDTSCEHLHLTELVTYITALAMNYISRGRFVQP